MASLPPANPKDSRPPSVRREIKWDALAAIIASLVGFLALLIAGYTAYIQRYTAQVQMAGVRAQVWPYLEIISSDALPSDLSGAAGGGLVLHKGGRFMVENKGVGPAIVERVSIEVGGKPQSNWADVLTALGLKQPTSLIVSVIGNTVMSPDETRNVLMVANPDEWGKIKTALFSKASRVIMRACYRSTLGDHWLATTDFHDLNIGVQPVRDCRVIPKADEFKR